MSWYVEFPKATASDGRYTAAPRAKPLHVEVAISARYASTKCCDRRDLKVTEKEREQQEGKLEDGRPGDSHIVT
jgi:hypothetical protein